jgi:FlgD Ig-like domain
VRARVTVGAALFGVLVIAVLITGVLVVRARTPDLVLEVTDPPASDPAAFSPRGALPNEVPITFFVREADSHALVGIVDSHEQVVRTLDSAVALSARDPVTYVWDGRTDAGAIAPPGRYRLLVDLPSEDREMIWPRRITLGPFAGDPSPPGVSVN